ncbi:head maturation protease, ClpP-related [Reyranella sp.]|uniref:head maturation protease, ClpP-related n=1 Tax=Reyranella sp. TaxID=1929291 RepID=UPI0027306CBD|nr:head maturation protease, ClpP-related [Reyranella sp.]MDP2377776.1 Clp protease ClpP [Reyranella sp.]
MPSYIGMLIFVLLLACLFAAMVLRNRSRPVGYLVFNLAGDKTAARAAWKARFENRRPPTEPRQAKKIEIKASSADTTDILLYDEIGWYGVTAKEFIAALATITTPNICVRINSPGGDVFDGLAIYNALKSHKGNVVCVVDGLAASAASFIAMAGTTVSIHESAMLMIHRAWGFAIGNEADMTEMAKVLAKIDGQLAGIYAKQTGKKAEEMLALMAGDSDGTWFTAQEAADGGFVDEIIDPDAETDDAGKTVAPGGEDEDPEMAKAMARFQAMRRRVALAEQD